MKVIEIREESHKKLLNDAKKAEMLLCELIESIMDLKEDVKYNERKHYEEYDEDEEDEDEDYESRHHSLKNMRRGRRSMRTNRYTY